MFFMEYEFKVRSFMNTPQAKAVRRLIIYQLDRQKVYKRAADSINERALERIFELNYEQSSLAITQMAGKQINPSEVGSSLIVRLLLLVMDIKWILGSRNRNSILSFCLIIESYTITMYKLMNIKKLPPETRRLVSKQMYFMNEARTVMEESKSQIRKGQPFAPHYKLI
jgi:hypothetical protein